MEQIDPVEELMPSPKAVIHEESPVIAPERQSVWSPVKRESFIERKIRLLQEADGIIGSDIRGRPSLDCLGIVPRMSRIEQEKHELQ